MSEPRKKWTTLVLYLNTTTMKLGIPVCSFIHLPTLLSFLSYSLSDMARVEPAFLVLFQVLPREELIAGGMPVAW